MKLEKGMIVAVDGIWYVVVLVRFCSERKKTYLYCICDNANNIYDFSVQDVDSYMTLKEIGKLGYGEPDRDILRNREIPYQVITEVLSGIHDDRFNHWFDKEI
jgi:hypothetical protein